MEEHEKAWGKELWIANRESYCGKILYLNKGYRCSYHYHKIKDETFYILKGRIFMEVGDIGLVMNPGERIHIPPGRKHRFSGITDAEIIEISTQHFEDDSYREDVSGPVPKKEE